MDRQRDRQTGRDRQLVSIFLEICDGDGDGGGGGGGGGGSSSSNRGSSSILTLEVNT
jgi:hypothetical protein